MTDKALDILLTQAREAMSAQIPFVFYAKPSQTSLKAVFQRNKSVSQVDLNSSGFAFCGFDSARQYFISFGLSDIFTAQYPEMTIPEITITSEVDQAEKTTFESLVAKGIAEINAGSFGKVVLSRKETVAIPDDFLILFSRILNAYPSAYRYCWYHPETGIWMGATPEKLLSVNHKKFKTVALAGTQRFVDADRVTWEQKEQEEQQFVSDFIAEGLRKHASEMQLSEPYTARAGNLLHIKTDISGTFTDDSSLEAAIKILHPTPAVCGYPKLAAKQFILANEGYDREFYSGYLGEINGGDCDLYVNLRCMKIENNSAHLYVGCGITAASNPEKEYYETVNKSLTMKKITATRK